MKKNLGITDRVLRFALAFWFLGPWQPQFQVPWVNILMIIVGVIALVESFIAWCGLHKVFAINNQDQ